MALLVLLLALQHRFDPLGDFLVMGSRIQIQLAHRLGDLLSFLAFLSLLGNGLRFCQGLQPSVIQEHGIGRPQLGHLVETASDKVFGNVRIACLRQTRRLSFDDGLWGKKEDS
jgi:hypothetical protein